MKAFIDRIFKKRKQNAEQVNSEVEEQVIEQPITQVESTKDEAPQTSIETVVEQHTDTKED